MQNPVLKFVRAFLIIIFIFPATVHAQLNTNLLVKADSLFQQKRYTQSFEIYNVLFESNQYSPSMLLKMAYIQEGLNRIAQSAYYLNLYYIATRDETAQVKLEELAGKYKLEGYENNELDRLFAIYTEYKNPVTIAIASVLFFFFVLCAVQRLRYGTKPYVAFGMLVVFAIILQVHLNTGKRYEQAIIMNDNTYLMDAPSAGASVVSIVRDGHRVQILGKKDVWLKISWGDSEAYIKENNLLPVRL